MVDSNRYKFVNNGDVISPYTVPLFQYMAFDAIHDDRDDILSMLLIGKGVIRIYDVPEDEEKHDNIAPSLLLTEAVDMYAHKCVHLLLEKGVDPNIPSYTKSILFDVEYDSDGFEVPSMHTSYTYAKYPLVVAVSKTYPSYDIVKDLLIHGANPNIITTPKITNSTHDDIDDDIRITSDRSILMTAILLSHGHNGNEEIVHLLKQYGAQLLPDEVDEYKKHLSSCY
jgi:uncharacterized protein (UPF0147 family)